MARSNILDKIRALLTTAGADSGATEAERATAVALAQKLMNKHRVEEHELAAREGRQVLPGIVMVDGGDYKQGSLWQTSLMQAIGDPMTVDVVHRRYVGGAEVTLVGRPGSVAYVKLVKDWLVPQLMRACDVAMDHDRTGAIQAGTPWSFPESIRFKRSFYFGAVDRLRERLAGEESEVGTDIVLSDRAAIDGAYEDAGMAVKTTAVQRAPLDTYAAAHGRAAGDKADLNPSNKLKGDQKGLTA